MPLVVRVSTVAMMRSISAVVRTSGRCLPNFGVSTNSAGDASIWSLMSRKLKTVSYTHLVVAEPQLYLRMFTDKAFRRQVLSQSERPLQHKAMLYFAAAHPQIERIRFDSIPEDRVIFDPQTVGRDTIALWFNMPSSALPDTIKGEITYFKHDTVNVLQSVTEPLKLAWRFIETKEQEKEREKLERDRRKAEAAGEEWVEPKKENPFAYKLPLSGEVNPENHLTMDFDYPLTKLDSAAMLLTLTHPDNSIEDIPVYLVRDTAQLRRYYIRAPWKTGGQYTLTIPEGAITDVDVYKRQRCNPVVP